MIRRAHAFLRGLRGLLGKILPAKPAHRHSVAFQEGDEVTGRPPAGQLVVAREAGVLWQAAMTCPCGCGRVLELMLLPEVRPRWTLSVDAGGLPSLHPSVWARGGCRSHFWLRRGVVEWCAPGGDGDEGDGDLADAETPGRPPGTGGRVPTDRRPRWTRWPWSSKTA